MTNVVTTIRFFGTYLLLVGLSLIVVPQLLGTALNYPLALQGPALRPLGIALVALSYYYFRSAGSGYRPFYEWTVHVRVGQFIIVIALTSLGQLSPLLLIPSAFEFATAVWTWFALKEPTGDVR